MTDRNNRDPHEMLARLEEMQRNAEETLSKFASMREQMAAESTEAVSEDGLVRVRLDENGHVVAIDIDDAALRNRANLAATIRSTIDEAVATHALKMAEMAQALAGDLDVMGLVTQNMPEHLRERAQENRDRRE